MSIDFDAIRRVLEAARERGQTALLETEGLEILEAMEISTPRHFFVCDADAAEKIDLAALEGERVVLKVISPEVLHKSDVGGVAVVPKQRDAIVAVVESMQRKFSRNSVAGFTVNEFVEYDRSLGNELLMGARWTDDFGPIVTFGPGGIYTEFLAKNFREGRDAAILSAHSENAERETALKSPAITELITGELRGQRPRIGLEEISEVAKKFQLLAATFMPSEISECEINPLVIADGRLVALDILIKRGDGKRRESADRPFRKIRNLLQPRSAALMGVSEKMNPGHIILNNLIREGFDREKIFVVKPGLERIEGCRCTPDIASMPEAVDLFILSIEAAQAPGAITEIIEQRKAEGIILIPGGLEEKQGTDVIVGRMREALRAARRTEWRGPVINGGNCLGITSRPGHYDTLFIPKHKLPTPATPVSPVAIISQSGAFAVARFSKLTAVNPRYSITLGNQMDLTIGDYLQYLKDDPEIELFAVYVEGFQPLDGLQFLRAAAEITASGRAVIFYRAGRTAAGAQAAASHTASIAGDYAVTRRLAEAAGVVAAERLADFEDLIKLFSALRGREMRGARLGAVSNAGFECVAMADNLGRLRLSSFTSATVSRLHRIFEAARIDKVVDVHNPIDLTPMTGDAAFAEVVHAVMDDERVDVGLVGCVPLTAALNTLPRGDGHCEDIEREDSIAHRLLRLREEIPKPWVLVIDSGALYDPMANHLEQQGIPVFRSADRALSLLNIYCAERLKHSAIREPTLSSVVEPAVVHA